MCLMKMSVRRAFPAIDFEIGTLPYGFRRNFVASGVVLIILACICTSGILWIATRGSSSNDFGFLAFLSLLPLSLLYMGVRRLGFRELNIDHDAVSLSVHYLWGPRAWTEPLTRYKGVMITVLRTHSSGVGAGGTTYIVALSHSNSSRDVRFGSFKAGGEARRNWERIASLLRVPALEVVDGSIVSHEPQSLGQTIHELAAADGAPSSRAPKVGRRPPRGLSAIDRNGVLSVVVEGKPSMLAEVFAIALLPAGMGGVLHFLGESLVICLIGSVVVFGLFSFLIALRLFSTERLEMSDGMLRLWRDTPFGKVAEAHFCPDEITEVILRKGADLDLYKHDPVARLAECIAIVSATQTRAIGAGLDSPALVWLRDTIICFAAEADQ
jgi:hypothetical protein